MKRAIAGIFTKKKTITSSETLGGLVMEYLDDARKPGSIDATAAKGVLGSDEEYRRMVNAKLLPMRPGVDFVASKARGKLVVGGVVSDWAGGNGSILAHEDAHEALPRISERWKSHMAGSHVKAHHVVYSVSPALQNALLGKGAPVQDVLMAGALNSLSRYAAWAYPGDSVGYMLGFHSDKRNAHLHGLILPVTGHGRRLNLSRMAKTELAGKKGRIDYQGYLHGAYDDYLYGWNQSLLVSGLSRPQIEVSASQALLGSIGLIKYCMGASEKDESGRPTQAVGALLDTYASQRPLLTTPLSFRQTQARIRDEFSEQAGSWDLNPAVRAAFAQSQAEKCASLAASLHMQASAAKASADRLEASNSRYLADPNGYRLEILPGTSLKVPKVLNPVELDAHVLTTDPRTSYRQWVDANLGVVTNRRKAAAALIKEVNEAIEETEVGVNPMLHGAELGAIYASRLEELRAHRQKRLPFHVGVDASRSPGPVGVCAPDRGFAALIGQVNRSIERFQQDYRPMSAELDLDRSYGPITFKHGENEGSAAVEILTEHSGDPSLLHKPTPMAVTPGEVDEQIRLMLESVRQRSIPLPQADESTIDPSGPTV